MYTAFVASYSQKFVDELIRSLLISCYNNILKNY